MPRFFLYQSTTISTPSGLITGTTSVMTLSLIFFISSDSSEAIRHMSSEVICAWAFSVACMPPSNHTMAFPSNDNCLASSGDIRARDSFSLMVRHVSSDFIFSSLEINNSFMGRPITDFPISIIFTRSVDASSLS